ncbi:MAG: hypothetical protein HQ536_00315 [Parcubacteria group bacterium]|nr:hypothetical protein [Parcubacteria group bacterium]
MSRTATNPIQVIGKRKGTREILDDAKTKKEAQKQVDYWKQLKPGWRISTTK